MYIGIKDGKIWDKCSELMFKRTLDVLPDDVYIKTNGKDNVVGDTWDFINNISLKDSPLRAIAVEKSLEQHIKDIETILGI